MAANAAQFDISICIPSTNKRHFLQACLRSLPQACRGLAFEAIVIDNASSDGTAEMVRQQFPWVHLIVNTYRQGSSANFNAGLSVAIGRYVAVLHEDTRCSPAMFTDVVGYMDAHPSVGCASPRAVFPDGSLDRSCGRFPGIRTTLAEHWLARLSRLGSTPVNSYAAEIGREPLVVETISATCLVMRREALHEVGLFDENFVIFYEEIDLQTRLRQASWQTVFLPQVCVIHHRGVTGKGGGDSWVSWQWLPSRYRYFAKHRGPLTLGVVRVADCLFAVSRIVFWSAAKLLLPSCAASARMKIQSYASVLAFALTYRVEYKPCSQARLHR